MRAAPVDGLRVLLDFKQGSFEMHVDLWLPGSGITAIVGPSGSGKTTLLRAVAGLAPTGEAVVAVNGRVWQADEFFMPPHRRAAGFVFQDNRLFEHLSVEQNIHYGLRRVPREERHLDLDHWIEVLDIGRVMHRRCATLSGGERQRVAIARALASHPRVLLMDEPLAALDESRRLEVMPSLLRLRDELKLPILYVSHASEEVVRLASWVVRMEQGRVRSSCNVAQYIGDLASPMLRSEGASAIVHATIDGFDDGYGLLAVKWGAQQLWMPTFDEARVGQPVRVRVQARDVSLALSAHEDTSVLNIIPVTVKQVHVLDAAQMLVALDADGQRLLARVTRRSVRQLDVAVGSQLFAQVKAVALLS